MHKVAVWCVLVWWTTQSYASVRSTSSKSLRADKKYCIDIGPTHDFDVDAILGMYYVSEIVYHLRNRTRTEQEWYCYQAHLRKNEDVLMDVDAATTQSYYAQQMTPSYQYMQRGAGVVPEQGYRHLVLQWYEPGNRLDYHVRFNMTRRGFWISTEPQYGAAIMAEMYTHFSGTIQVLKAVSNHLVLSFCRRLPKEQLFTVIFSRQKHRLDDGELIGIHNLLSRKQLSTSTIKKVCNSAVSPLATSASTALAAILCYFLSHNWRNVL